MELLNIISLTLGFIGCVFVIVSFICQLYEIYRTKNADGTSWGLILAQIITCLDFGSSAAINIYVGVLINLPFLYPHFNYYGVNASPASFSALWTKYPSAK